MTTSTREANLPSWLDATARQRTDQVAIVDIRGQVTYGELLEQARRLGSRLRAEGVEQGDRVLLALEPSALYVASLLGVMYSGGIACPVNTRSATAEAERYAQRLAPSTVITEPAYQHLVSEVDARTFSLPTSTSGDIAQQLGPLGGGTPVPVEVLAHWPAAIFPTGGTTGSPKGALWDHAGLLSATANFSLTYRRQPNDVELYFSPFFHITLVAGVLGPLFSGAQTIVMRGFDADEAMTLMERHAVNRLIGAPTIFTALAGCDNAVSRGSSIRHVLFGSASTTSGFVDQLREQFPNADIQTSYGATEFGGGVTQITSAEFCNGTAHGVGRALPGAELRILDEAGLAAPIGTVGEIAARSPWQTIGYWNDDEATSSTYLEDGFIRLGDLGVLGSDLHLTLMGRIKDMIISGGENIFPSEIEEALARCGGIHQSVAFGVADPYWGERAEAVVVPLAGAQLTGESLREALREHLAGYKIPKRIHIVTDVPLTANHKPDRSRLATMYTSHNETCPSEG